MQNLDMGQGVLGVGRIGEGHTLGRIHRRSRPRHGDGDLLAPWQGLRVVGEFRGEILHVLAGGGFPLAQNGDGRLVARPRTQALAQLVGQFQRVEVREREGREAALHAAHDVLLEMHDLFRVVLFAVQIGVHAPQPVFLGAMAALRDVHAKEVIDACPRRRGQLLRLADVEPGQAGVVFVQDSNVLALNLRALHQFLFEPRLFSPLPLIAQGEILVHGRQFSQNALRHLGLLAGLGLDREDIAFAENE